jgi:hypothetical protein
MQAITLAKMTKRKSMRSQKLKLVTSSCPVRMSFPATFQRIYLGSLFPMKELLYFEPLSDWRLHIWLLAVSSLHAQHVPAEPILRPCAISKMSAYLQPDAHACLKIVSTQFTSATDVASLCCARTTRRKTEDLALQSSALTVSSKREESHESRGKEIVCESTARKDTREIRARV